jgi:hypothetical protein
MCAERLFPNRKSATSAGALTVTVDWIGEKLLA